VSGIVRYVTGSSVTLRGVAQFRRMRGSGEMFGGVNGEASDLPRAFRQWEGHLATVVHLAAAYERNDGIACEGWYYPLNREHVVSSDFGSVTCPTCIEEVAFQEAEAEAEAEEWILS
jgi:hypothetical protein